MAASKQNYRLKQQLYQEEEVAFDAGSKHGHIYQAVYPHFLYTMLKNIGSHKMKWSPSLALFLKETEVISTEDSGTSHMGVL